MVLKFHDTLIYLKGILGEYDFENSEKIVLFLFKKSKYLTIQLRMLFKFFPPLSTQKSGKNVITPKVLKSHRKTQPHALSLEQTAITECVVVCPKQLVQSDRVSSPLIKNCSAVKPRYQHMIIKEKGEKKEEEWVSKRDKERREPLEGKSIYKAENCQKTCV